MEGFGVKVNKYGGLLQLSRSEWPVTVHCLSRGNGHFLPIRRPTKEELGTLPQLELTANNVTEQHLLQMQVNQIFDLTRRTGLPARGKRKQKPNQSRRNSKRRKKGRRNTSAKGRVRQSSADPAPAKGTGNGGSEPLEPAPETGPRDEATDVVAKALAAWGEIFDISDLNTVLKTLRANTAEAVELELENRTIPRKIKKPDSHS